MSVEVPSRAQLRIEEAVSSWATPAAIVEKEKDKEKKKDKEKEKEKDKEELPQKKIQSAVIEWSGGAVKDIKKEAKKKEKEEKRQREALKKREKEEKKKDEKKRKETLGVDGLPLTPDQQPQNLTIEGLSLATPTATTTSQQPIKSRRLIPFFKPKEASTPTNTSPQQSPPTSQSLNHLPPSTEEDENVPVPLRHRAMKNLLNFLEKINGKSFETFFLFFRLSSLSFEQRVKLTDVHFFFFYFCSR